MLKAARPVVHLMDHFVHQAVCITPDVHISAYNSRAIWTDWLYRQYTNKGEKYHRRMVFDFKQKGQRNIRLVQK